MFSPKGDRFSYEVVFSGAKDSGLAVEARQLVVEPGQPIVFDCAVKDASGKPRANFSFGVEDPLSQPVSPVKNRSVRKLHRYGPNHNRHEAWALRLRFLRRRRSCAGGLDCCLRRKFQARPGTSNSERAPWLLGLCGGEFHPTTRELCHRQSLRLRRYNHPLNHNNPTLPHGRLGLARQ